MTLPPRVSLVTLGARDLEGATAFYERLGWRWSSASTDGVSFFHTGGAVLGLYPGKPSPRMQNIVRRGRLRRRRAGGERG